ncbi:hypothetical protein AAFF_G00216200 [Aldrovandia affinis]|uniref:Uncharacterized protein n=1 Tax=Aldrovandia affinis TaxID=143900 RepID=A0AAD7RG95_9TELE|nr:hypothetical protein AAFF_G00216200 [Aldrovandia affinis]
MVRWRGLGLEERVTVLPSLMDRLGEVSMSLVTGPVCIGEVSISIGTGPVCIGEVSMSLGTGPVCIGEVSGSIGTGPVCIGEVSGSLGCRLLGSVSPVLSPCSGRRGSCFIFDAFLCLYF